MVMIQLASSLQSAELPHMCHWSYSGHRRRPIVIISTIIADYSKKLFSLNSRVMDDNHDRYKTANIEINQFF
jgi:hypothetical protein